MYLCARICIYSASSDTLSGDQVAAQVLIPHPVTIQCNYDTISGQVVAKLAEVTPDQHLLDTYITTIVTALQSKPEDTVAQSLLDILLKLLVSSDTMTRITTSVLAIECLKSSMAAHKNYIFAWGARAMCSGDHRVEEILDYPLMMCSSEESQRALLENNLHHLLPPIILHSVSDSAAADETLDFIAR